MNYFVKTYESLSIEEKNQFYNFCRTAYKETNDPASKNMWDENYLEAPWTVIYKLEKTDTFTESNGKFFVLFLNDRVVGCSGVYRSPFSHDIYLGGVRTWIDKEYRNQLLNKKFLFPIQKKWVLEQQGKLIALTFNRYNKNIIEIFKRNRLGEISGRINTREPNELFYNGFNEVLFPIWLHNTKQWACFELLDSTFDFDWSSIKYDSNKHF